MLKNAQHYHILTDDDWIDVISDNPPVITSLSVVG
jgi:hypothetical protein